MSAIDAALAANDLARAAALAEAALAAGEESALLLNLAAWAREEAGDFAGAHALLDRALALSPGDPSILAAKGGALRKAGDLGTALHTLDAAIAVAPDFAVPWLERGYTLEAGGSFALAGQSYARAAALDPSLAPAHAGVAAVAARTGDHRALREAAARALALDPNEPGATRALATAEIEADEAEAARQRLDRLLGTHLGPADHIAALTLRGDALDKAGDTSAAFADWMVAKAEFAALHAGARTGTQADWIAAIDDEVARIADWSPASCAPVTGASAAQIILTGYPRSGTTLVENILASAPGVAALEERPTMAEADIAFLAEPATGIPALAALDDATPYVGDYWRRVAAAGAAGAALVDMDPMKATRLPLVARLFPQARVVIMRRDPRDVVLGCFRTSFALSASALDFTTLEGVARHYDALMRLTERCLATMPINAFELRYDRLVADFDATMRALCGFTGIPWTPAMRDFASTAKRRGVATASAGQVRRGLYDGGGKWRRYEARLAPVMPILQPWVEKLGFAA